MRRAALALLTCLVALPAAATAQPHSRRIVAPPRAAPVTALSDDPRDLRARFGVPLASRLIESSDADERLRGIERAAALGTPEGIALLVRDASAPHVDGRADIAIARGLAMHSEEASARAALLAIVEPSAAARPSREDDARDPERRAEVDLARRIAALAVARSGDATRVDKLVQIARGAGPGRAAAEDALVHFPAEGTAAWGKWTPGATRLLARTGDERATGMTLDLARHGDVSTRAAAIESLAALGDARVLEIARGVRSEDDSRLRTAAATAFVALGTPEAAAAVEGLLADDLTAARGLALASRTHGPGLVRALAAAASVTTDLAVRADAIAALGRDPGDEGIEALVALAADPTVRADTMDAVARSPSRAAMPALEKLAGVATSRRVAVRAYVVRAVARGEKSGAMDQAVADLARAGDGRDRAVGAFARVALGEDGVDAWLDDRDPAVRRAVAMAAPANRSTWARARALLLSRRAREEDPVTRAVLGVALADGGPDAADRARGVPPLECARAGGPDAPLCTMAFAQQADADDAPLIDSWLTSADPVIRAHAARGVALGHDPTRSGRLAAAYAYEVSPRVRRALVAGFATSPEAPAVTATLAFAAQFDPDPEARWIAGRIQAHLPLLDASDATDIAWIRLVDANGAPPPAGMTGVLVRPDGLAVPIAFDADGDALVAGVEPGASRLVLAPRLGAAYARGP